MAYFASYIRSLIDLLPAKFWSLLSRERNLIAGEKGFEFEVGPIILSCLIWGESFSEIAYSSVIFNPYSFKSGLIFFTLTQLKRGILNLALFYLAQRKMNGNKFKPKNPYSLCFIPKKNIKCTMDLFWIYFRWLKVAFFHKMRFVFQISKSPKKQFSKKLSWTWNLNFKSRIVFRNNFF